VRLTLCAILLAAASVLAQPAPVTGVFFTEGWESGSASGSFNSSFYGSAAGSQFAVQNTVRASGSFALRHILPSNISPGSIQYATQHFGDAVSGPVWPTGQGQHFMDLYVQYKVYYAPGFDFWGYAYKQLIIGTQDDRRHDNPCCNPWVAHYMTIYPPGRSLLAEANNKQAASGQWVGFSQNAGGHSDSNRLTLQTGRWYTIEVRRRLNDSGVDNGIFQMWVDGQIISDYRSVRYRVPYNGSFGTTMTYGTNFAMISDYGGPVSQEQRIFYDDIKMSTTYIGTGASAPTAPTNLRIVR
jgi:hypothetical protein